MQKRLSIWRVAAVLSCVARLTAQAPLFSLREMDLHLHAGVERDAPDLDKWIDLQVKDGRKVLLLVDHLERYRLKGPALYPRGPEGHRALMADFDGVAARHKDLIIFKGWEVNSKELDTGLEMAPLRMADAIDWHISLNLGEPAGQILIKRVKQLKELQKQLPIPMILAHPFQMRIGNLKKAFQEQGRDPKSITVADYRFFQPGEQQELIGLLKGSSVYVELSNSTSPCIRDPVCREAFLADIKPLADAGVKFSVSTDRHYLKDTQRPFRPEAACELLGVTVDNANAIVRELLAKRAK